MRITTRAKRRIEDRYQQQRLTLRWLFEAAEATRTAWGTTPVYRFSRPMDPESWRIGTFVNPL